LDLLERKEEYCGAGGIQLDQQAQSLQSGDDNRICVPECQLCPAGSLRYCRAKGGVLEDGQYQAGGYSFDWESSDNAFGIYLHRLTTDVFCQTKKMALIK